MPGMEIQKKRLLADDGIKKGSVHVKVKFRSVPEKSTT